MCGQLRVRSGKCVPTATPVWSGNRADGLSELTTMVSPMQPTTILLIVISIASTAFGGITESPLYIDDRFLALRRLAFFR